MPGCLPFLAAWDSSSCPTRAGPWPAGRFIGVVAVGLSLILEVLWVFSDAKWPRWLLPSTSTAQAPSLPDEGTDHLFGDPVRDEIASNLRRCVELLEIMAADQ